MHLEYHVLVGWNSGEPRIQLATAFGYVSRLSTVLTPDKKGEEIPAVTEMLKAMRVVPAYNLAGNQEHANVCEKLLNAAVEVVETMAWEDKSNVEMSYDNFVISIKAEKSYAQVDLTEK